MGWVLNIKMWFIKYILKFIIKFWKQLSLVSLHLYSCHSLNLKSTVNCIFKETVKNKESTVILWFPISYFLDKNGSKFPLWSFFFSQFLLPERFLLWKKSPWIKKNICIIDSRFIANFSQSDHQYCGKCSLYWDIHYMEYPLYRESTVLFTFWKTIFFNHWVSVILSFLSLFFFLLQI